MAVLTGNITINSAFWGGLRVKDNQAGSQLEVAPTY